jgi:hypothetical protein
VINLEGKRPHWKPRRRWKDCIKIIVHVENMDSIEMVQPKTLCRTAVKEAIKRQQSFEFPKRRRIFWLATRQGCIA